MGSFAQTAIVSLAVLVAVIYLVRCAARYARRMAGLGSGRCGGCSGCADTPVAPTQHPVAFDPPRKRTS